ncbi:hypothetical protein [Cylindrospermum sp. FACHB-282]|uniref:hypothetical protein n=1 Tax=Cylindrospermum sp. FACHB-282 TaxID=2692794 RepID=UPI001687F1DE|nr:hypothetical protein [Cylindrospermum sp. FACHB-282]MBD2384894.1 hypothetical protein [Cylindrospermum sp. FACHB-282]
MNSVRLADLDDLILSVRDKTSRSHISEAVNAYRGGAYRAAIVATWIAVCFDIIAKIKELASQGTPNASDFIKDLDKAISSKNIPKLQKIEEFLLENAYKGTTDSPDQSYEFLSLHEYTDLQRLKADRNLCAHPAFVAEEALFQPTPELVRTHIVHAILHLLQHQPVQGKSAIERIMSEIKGTLFPPDLEVVCTLLNTKYLNRSKESFIRNLIDVLLKTLLLMEEPDFMSKVNEISHVLIAIRRVRPTIYEERLSAKLPSIVERLTNDHGLASIFRLLSMDSRCWNWLTEGNKIHIKELLKIIIKDKNLQEKLTKVIDYKLFDSLSIEDLKPFLIELFNKFNYSSKLEIITKYPNPIFAEEAILYYSKVSSYNDAEVLGNTILIPMASYFSFIQIKKILEAIMSNDQIYHASKSIKVIECFFIATINHLEFTKDSWQKLAMFFCEKGYFDENGQRWEVYQSWSCSSLKTTLQKYNIHVER